MGQEARLPALEEEWPALHLRKLSLELRPAGKPPAFMPALHLGRRPSADLLLMSTFFYFVVLGFHM